MPSHGLQNAVEALRGGGLEVAGVDAATDVVCLEVFIARVHRGGLLLARHVWNSMYEGNKLDFETLH